MNIFYLHKTPTVSVKMHCDKHVVKMVIEYAQLLSTAHRMLDGTQWIDASSGRRIKRWRLDDSKMDSVLYKASHINHPSAIWVRQNNSQYQYMYNMFENLCEEYTYRYGKIHMTDSKLRELLVDSPKNIPIGSFQEPPQCMPDNCKQDSTVDAYKLYYVEEKKDFAKWTKRPTPMWFIEGLRFYAT